MYAAAVLLGAFFHQVTFAVHDLAHTGVTGSYFWDRVIAIVVADTFEAAREAAHKVEVDYAAEPPSATFGSPGAEEHAHADLAKGGGSGPEGHEDPKVGDAQAAFASAPVKVDATYFTPTQHHNPMELFTTACVWRDGKLTIHESSQFVHGLRAAVAKQLGMDAPPAASKPQPAKPAPKK